MVCNVAEATASHQWKNEQEPVTPAVVFVKLTEPADKWTLAC